MQSGKGVEGRVSELCSIKAWRQHKTAFVDSHTAFNNPRVSLSGCLANETLMAVLMSGRKSITAKFEGKGCSCGISSPQFEGCNVGTRTHKHVKVKQPVEALAAVAAAAPSSHLDC